MVILVLQRGWVAIGSLEREGPSLVLRRAAIIRRWGTTKGLGQLALEGPRPETIVDPCGELRAHELTVVLELAVSSEAERAWTSRLA